MFDSGRPISWRCPLLCPEFLPNVRDAADAIRELNSPAPKILLGGKALDKTNRDMDGLGCDATAGNVLEAVTEARQTCRSDGREADSR